MSLSKGFLSQREIIKKERIISGLILWVLLAYPLYALFYMYREAIRILTNGLGGRILLVLSDQETFIYNLFYASIAVALGFMFSLKFVLENSISPRAPKNRFRIRQVLNQQGFFAWSFLLWFGKVAGLLGIWCLTFPIQYSIDFLREMPVFLLLLPLTLFLSTWPQLRLAFGTNSRQWFGSLSLLFVVFSLILANKNFMDVGVINKSLLENSIEHVYNLEVPKSGNHQLMRRNSIVPDLYVVMDTISSEKPKLFLGDINNEIQWSRLRRMINQVGDKLSESERKNLAVNLHIDKHVKMGFVSKLKYEFRKCGARKIQYSTVGQESKYPSTSYVFKYSGIPQLLEPWYYPKFDAFLDSAENLDYSKYQIRLPESLMYRINSLKGHNRIEIFLNEWETTLNGQVVSQEELGQIVHKFIKRCAPDYKIIFNADDEVTYGKYIEHLDLILSVIKKLKTVQPIILSKQDSHSWSVMGKYYKPPVEYPHNIIEWSFEERRLIKLMEKSGSW